MFLVLPSTASIFFDLGSLRFPLSFRSDYRPGLHYFVNILALLFECIEGFLSQNLWVWRCRDDFMGGRAYDVKMLFAYTPHVLRCWKSMRSFFECHPRRALSVDFEVAGRTRFDLPYIVSNICNTMSTHKLCAAYQQHKTPHSLTLYYRQWRWFWYVRGTCELLFLIVHYNPPQQTVTATWVNLQVWSDF